MRLKYLFKVFIFFLCAESATYTVCAQATGLNNKRAKDEPSISWVCKLPEIRETKKKPTFLKSLFELITGKNSRKAVVRPVAVYANSTKDMVVLDQGLENIVQLKKKSTDVMKATRNKEHYFTSLVGLCRMNNGDYLFTDSRLNKVFVIGSNNKLKVLNDTLKLEQPTGIAYSGVTDEIWVVETNAHRISILDRNGGLVKTIGSRGDEHGQFNYPTSVWIDKSGEAFVVDAMNFRVQIFDKNGNFETLFGELGDGSGYFARPKGIATDEFGNIYVADAQFHVIQIFDKKGEFLYRFGSQGQNNEEFWMPSGIYIDKENYIYVADTYNSRIQVFKLINGS